ncbi:MAG: DUF4835 family protein [Bacteroidota bacterium]|nr:DUF4835 family protein [Bacteroidota bacterium]
MRKSLVIAAVLLLAVPQTQAREFLCTAAINYRQLEGSGFEFLDELKDLVEDYMNNNSWTDDRFETYELIACSIQIVFVESFTMTSFQAQLILTSSRPIYGTTARSTLLQISDNQWQFDFAQGTPLIFETERFDQLTSVLDYYAYLMLGYDYDTFSELGGEVHFQKAKRIQQLATTANAIGWSTLESDGRARIIDQMTAPQYKPLREAYFRYHFEGLDHFTRDASAARQAVLDVLTTMQELYQELSSQYVFDIFFSTKFHELVGLFEESDVSSAAYDLLVDVDPSHLTSYNALIE